MLIEDRVHIRIAHNHDADNKLVEGLEARASILHVTKDTFQPESTPSYDNKIECPQCDKSFSMKGITRHINEVHLRIKQFNCML